MRDVCLGVHGQALDMWQTAADTPCLMLPRLQADLTAPVWVAEQEEEEDTILVDDTESWRQVWERRRWLDPTRSEVRDDRKCLPCLPLPAQHKHSYLHSRRAPPPRVHQAPASPTRSAHAYPSLPLLHASPTQLPRVSRHSCCVTQHPPTPTFTPHIHYLLSPVPPCPMAVITAHVDFLLN